MDPELSKAINELIIAVLGGITTFVLPMAYSLLRSYAKAKIEAVKDKNTREALEYALTRLDNTAQTVVEEVEATRKEFVSDGELSKEEAKKLLSIAYTRIRQRLPQDAIDILQTTFDARLQGVIIGKIESKVAAL